MNRTVIDAYLPSGLFLVYKDGQFMRDLKEFEFIAEVEKAPTYTATFGLFNDDNQYKTDGIHCRIESDGTPMGTFLYLNGELQRGVQKLHLKCDEKSNELKIQSYFAN